MKLESACRLAGRSVAFGIGLCLAVVLLTNGQAFAAGKSTTTTEAPVLPAPLTIEPESGYANAVLGLAYYGISNQGGDPYFAQSVPGTRAQLAVYIARALKLPAGQTPSFTAVGADEPVAAARRVGGHAGPSGDEAGRGRSSGRGAPIRVEGTRDQVPGYSYLI